MTEYSRRGSVGILLPPANPTVEPEARRLLAPDVALHSARLPVHDGDLADRLHHYNATLEETVATYGGMSLDVVYYACTGASYLNGRADEARLREALASGGSTPLTAADAIVDTMADVAANRIAIVSPYPDFLTAAASRYWTDAALDVVDVVSMDAPNGIYALTSDDLLQLGRPLLDARPDAILLSGTGVPTITACLELSRAFELPVLSSSVCAAWRTARLLDDVAPPTGPALQELMEWLLGGRKGNNP